MIRPTDNPLRELATALAEVAHADADSAYRLLSAAPAEAPMLVELAVRTVPAAVHTQNQAGCPILRPLRRPAWC